MFQTKDFSSIAASMINYAKAIQSRITDFSVGSVARTMLEAPAVEIEELYQQMWLGLKESVPVAIYNSFDFERHPARPATGLVRVSISPAAGNTIIPAGSRFEPAGYSIPFTSPADAVIAAGQSYADVFVEAVTPGAVGNVVGGTQFTVEPAVPGFQSAEAVTTFTTGADVESDDQRKARFVSYILTLNRGTVAALQYGLSLAVVRDAQGNVMEQARHVAIIEPYKTDPNAPISLVNCYIHNGVSGATTDLIADAQKVIDGYVDSNGTRIPGWKAAGVKVTIQAAANVSINVTATVTILSGYIEADVLVAVERAMADYVASLNIGADCLVAELIAAAMQVPGVTNISMSLPSGDVAISDVQKAMVGAFTMTAA